MINTLLYSKKLLKSSAVDIIEVSDFHCGNDDGSGWGNGSSDGPGNRDGNDLSWGSSNGCGSDEGKGCGDNMDNNYGNGRGFGSGFS